jgi:uncharacterized protein YbbC (DUF1343 family)
LNTYQPVKKNIAMIKSLLFSLLFIATIGCSAQKEKSLSTEHPKILAGAERTTVYLPLIRGKRVGIFANQTSMVGSSHLVDTLRKLGVNIKVIFGPEHGFRGTADAGEHVGNYIDKKSGIPVVSLYGTKRKPSTEDLKDVDILEYRF